MKTKMLADFEICISAPLNYVMFMLISSEPIKVADLQKLANQLMLNGTLVIEMVNNSLSESKNVLTKAKTEILREVKNIFYHARFH